MAKDRVAKIEYVNADGEKVTSPFEAQGIRWNFFDPDAPSPAEGEERPVKETRTVMFDSIRDEASQNGVEIDSAFAAYGAKQVLSDAYAGRKGKGENAWDMLDSRLEMLVNGEYKAEHGASRGASRTLLAKAVKRAIEETGTEVDDAMFARITESLANEDAREAAKAKPQIAYHYDAIKAERAVERAKKRAEAAKAAGELDLGSLGL